MKRSATAIWTGSIKDGMGSITTQSGVLSDAHYGFNTRFENEPGTNPEELIAAAHAGCFNMAFAAQLNETSMVAQSISTTATVTLDKVDDGFAITTVHLDLVARISGANQTAFDVAANRAKTRCPVSRLLNTKVTLNARLET